MMEDLSTTEKDLSTIEDLSSGEYSSDDGVVSEGTMMGDLLSAQYGLRNMPLQERIQVLMDRLELVRDEMEDVVPELTDDEIEGRIDRISYEFITIKGTLGEM
jgi:hypothetical protein